MHRKRSQMSSLREVLLVSRNPLFLYEIFEHFHSSFPSLLLTILLICPPGRCHSITRYSTIFFFGLPSTAVEGEGQPEKEPPWSSLLVEGDNGGERKGLGIGSSPLPRLFFFLYTL